MKNILFVLAFLLMSFPGFSQHAKPATTQKTKVYDFADKMPYPSYDVGEYLSKVLVYPDAAINANVQGRVLVRFVVFEDGSIHDGKVARGLSAECDSEALKAVKAMPKWVAGENAGKKVKVYFTQPIQFKLEVPEPELPEHMEMPDPEPEPAQDTVFHQVSTMPKAPLDMAEFLARNLRYPDKALENHIQGRVIVKFIVRKDGRTTDFQIVKGVSREVNEEAIRVLKLMPRWDPGLENGKPVDCYFNQPFFFSLPH